MLHILLHLKKIPVGSGFLGCPVYIVQILGQRTADLCADVAGAFIGLIFQLPASDFVKNVISQQNQKDKWYKGYTYNPMNGKGFQTFFHVWAILSKNVDIFIKIL